MIEEETNQIYEEIDESKTDYLLFMMPTECQLQNSKGK